MLNLAEELGNVSQACKVMGLSRDTFYRYKEAVDNGGVEALLHKNQRVPNLKNRVYENTENAVVEYAIEFPGHGQTRASNELRKKGVFISGSGVRSVWLRHDLACFKSRLKDLEDKFAKEGIILTESQVTALETNKHDDEASGEIENKLPLLRILTDRGTEYCGKAEKHDYQLYLALNDIDHTKTKVKSPQTNGICERFQKTVLQKFYQITFRKKLYGRY